MKKIFFILFILLPLQFSISQDNQADVEQAYTNARKGISWAMSNIPENKLRISHDLIAGNNLISTVKLDVEVNGVKINASGYYNSTQVDIKLYRSIDSLKKWGYLKNKRLKRPGDD